MKIKLTIFCLTLLLSPCVIFAQANFRPASIIKMNGDTTLGFIKYEGWTHSPTSIQFKNNTANAQTEILFAKDIKGFNVNGIEEYVSYNGVVSTNKIEGADIPYQRDSAVKSVTVFLHMLSNGANVRLLAYRDDVKTAYFISEKNTQPEELRFCRYYNDERIAVSAPFRAVLAGLLEKYRGANEKWFRDVGTADYNLATLQKLVKAINNEQNENVSIGGHRFFVGAGIAYQRSTFTGANGFNFQPASNIQPVINVGYDLFSNRFVPKTILRLEGSFSQISPVFNGNVSYFKYKALVVGLKPALLYVLASEQKVRPFLGVGLTVNVPIQTENAVTATESGRVLPHGLAIQNKGDSYASLQAGESVKNPYYSLGVYITPEVKAGLFFNKKIEVNLSATVLSTPMLRSTYPSHIGVYSVSFNYAIDVK